MGLRIVYGSLIIAMLVLLISFPLPGNTQEAHKRTAGNKEEYELRIANKTKWFVIVHIDGRRVALLNPQETYYNNWDGSLVKAWLPLGPHNVVAFAYESRKDITNDRPVGRTPENTIDLAKYVDKERPAMGPFRVPLLELEKDNFESWTTPLYRHKPQRY